MSRPLQLTTVENSGIHRLAPNDAVLTLLVVASHPPACAGNHGSKMSRCHRPMSRGAASYPAPANPARGAAWAIATASLSL